MVATRIDSARLSVEIPRRTDKSIRGRILSSGRSSEVSAITLVTSGVTAGLCRIWLASSLAKVATVALSVPTTTSEIARKREEETARLADLERRQKHEEAVRLVDLERKRLDEQKRLDAVSESLAALKQALAESEDFRELTTSPLVGRDEALRAVAATADALALDPVTTNFLGVLARNRRLARLGAIIRAFNTLAARHRGEIKAAEAAGEDVAAVRTRLANEYTYNVASPFLAAERGELDGIIEPAATRVAVIKALRALRTKRASLPPKQHGNIPL